MGLYADNEICTICLADNGFIVKLKDPEADANYKKALKAQKGSGYVQSPDPEIVVCETTAALMKLIKEKLPAIVSESEQYAEAFADASSSPAAKSKY